MPTDLSIAFESLWREEPPPDVFGYLAQHSDLSNEAAVSVLLVDQRYRWKSSQPIQVEEYLQRVPKLANDKSSQFDLVAGEFRARNLSAEESNLSEYESRFPELTPSLRQQLLACLESSESVAAGGLRAEEDSAAESESDSLSMFPVTSDPSFPPVSQDKTRLMGRYRRVRILGQGAFGRVYLGFDEELHRQVAIKVPTKEALLGEQNSEQYLSEARMVASLEHPHIVPVYDVGRTEEYPVYVVSRYIEGSTLAERIEQGPIAPAEAAELVATIAEALDYAHSRRLIHRDVKPANILLEEDSQKAFITDFGLAIREEEYLRDGRLAGTPAYMSPEQARGEGHRLDGRSDLFSLGIIFYELLTGTRPFEGETSVETLYQVISATPVPPRQRCPDLPPELERICLRCLEKRAAARYATALELVEDLQHCLAAQPKSLSDTSAVRAGQTAGSGSTCVVGDSGKTQGDSAKDRSDSQPIKIVPKGLRSFDAHDADFFLELLPGPRDRYGLPDSLRFWKTRIEETDADHTFSVGLIYGPSGCGKSSLIKAGLLPRLSANVIPIYVEATPEETETRLLHGLRKACPNLNPDLGLVDSLMAIRQGMATSSGKKVLIVLDQFEQWLHAKKEERELELVRSLRQCDGGRVQCIVMVRDDFWLAVSRFLRDLEVRLVEGENSALADLFDIAHARKVLTAFGQAFGKLPEASADTNQDQRKFLSEAVAGLAEEGKVICVRLSLFAEMMKGKTWTPAVLKEVGGTQGVGVTFLEETFSASTAPPEHRYHQKAARSVLKALLPNPGTDIKGHMLSYAGLLDTSGYASRPGDFAELIRILDNELRLITPTDPEGLDDDNESEAPLQTGEKYFQLTHDYLVPSLRDWLTSKQKETRRGRTELKLADSSGSWSAKPENRFLPSWWDHLTIRLLTDKSKWTEPQQKMMSRAGRVHGIRSAIALTVIIVFVAGGFGIRSQIERNLQELIAQKQQEQEAIRIEGLVGQLISSEPSQIPKIVAELDANPEIAASSFKPLLSGEARTLNEQRALLHARLATVGRDPSQVEPLVEELLTGKVTYVLPIRQMLIPWAATLTERFGEVLRNDKDPQRRFRAALALAEYGPPSATNGWTDEDLKSVAEQLVSSNAEYQPLLREALRPIRDKLLPDLGRIFAAADATDAQRLSAANAFADYAASDVDRLSQLLMVATPEQFAVLYPLVAASPSPLTVEKLSKTAATLPSDELGSVQRIAYGQQRANAAVTLVRLGEREKVLPVFDYTDDPEALTQFIFRCRERGVSAEPLLELLDIVSRRVIEGPALEITSEAFRQSARARYALLLALGEFQLDDIPETRRKPLLEQLADWYANDPSSGVHGASGWLLRQWGQTETAQKIEQTEVPYSRDREWFTLAITVTPTSPQKPASPEEDKDLKPDAEKNDNASPADPESAANDENSPSEEPSKSEFESGNEPSELLKKTFYFTFIVFPADEYWIGSLDDEPDRKPDETRHQVKLKRPFAVLDREITMEELIAFQPFYVGPMQKFDAGPGDAGFGADWYDAVGFSRWLGQQMGLPEDQQAYPAPDALDEAEYPREPDPQANWAPRNWPLELGNSGFRLPTESEWEVVARAGSRTAYGFSSDASLLERFGWIVDNSGKHVHPPRVLRPSLRGIFDLHGNLFEWTHDWSDDTEIPESYRRKRGGAWNREAAFSRSAARVGFTPTSRSIDGGFRLALSPSAESPEAQDEQAEPGGEGTEGASAEQRPKMP